jgi:hypothetical protein
MPYQSITDSYSKIIRTTLEHYQQGRTKPIQTTPEISGNLAKHKLETFIEARLPLTDRLLMRKFENARTLGLIAARQGDSIKARRLFALARAPLKFDKLSPEGSLFYKSFLEQAEAYLDYRCGNFDLARNRTSQALAIDSVLEEEYGYEILLLHRIQLVHNLARIDARCLYLNRAIQLISQILSYLAQESEALPIQGFWGCERVKRQSPKDVAAMFIQVSGEIALILADREKQLASNLFAIIASHLNLQIDINRQCDPRSYSWLLVKQAFVNRDVTKFLELASQFLGEGRGSNPLLWYATVIDLVAMCEEVNFPDSELVKQEIANDATTWEYLPPKFSSLLGLPPKTKAA